VSIRVRISRVPHVDRIDGIHVGGFEVGRIYDLGTSIAAVLLAEGWAEPVPLDAARPPEPFGEADPCSAPPYRDPDAPRNLTREHFPPYLDERSHATNIERRKRRRAR
jgi:hypothetical protein